MFPSSELSFARPEPVLVVIEMWVAMLAGWGGALKHSHVIFFKTQGDTCFNIRQGETISRN